MGCLSADPLVRGFLILLSERLAGHSEYWTTFRILCDDNETVGCFYTSGPKRHERCRMFTVYESYVALGIIREIPFADPECVEQTALWLLFCDQPPGYGIGQVRHV